MKVYFTFTCLFVVSTIFAVSSEYSIEDKTSLFEEYLSACEFQDKKCQPVHLRNRSKEKESFFAKMTILDLDISKTMQIEEVAKGALYGEADIVHFANISTQRASRLYQILENTYSHFIHVPSHGHGLLIASKYPLSQAVVTIVEEDTLSKEILEFSIEGASVCKARVFSNELSTQIVNVSESKNSVLTPLYLADAPATLTLMKQEFSPFQVEQKVDLLAADMFQILPIKHRRERDNDDRAGYSGEIEIKRSWGGKDGGHWEGSARFEAHDNRGNYVEGEVKQNDKGEGFTTARGGHEKD